MVLRTKNIVCISTMLKDATYCFDGWLLFLNSNEHNQNRSLYCENQTRKQTDKNMRNLNLDFTHKNPPLPFSREQSQDEKIVWLAEKGYSSAQIADKLFRSRSTPEIFRESNAYKSFVTYIKTKMGER